MTSYEQNYKSAVDELKQECKTAVETVFAVADGSPQKVEMLAAVAIIMGGIYDKGFRKGYEECQTVSAKEKTNE